MEFADYWVAPKSSLATAKKHYAAEAIMDAKLDWIAIFTLDKKLPRKLDIAMHFHDDEGAAWGFTLYRKGKEIASGLFGENAETGVDAEDNFLDGDLDVAAKTLDVDAKKLKKIFAQDVPDSGAFAKLVGFAFLPFSSSEVERELERKKKPKKKKKK